MKWIKNKKEIKDDVLRPGMVFERYTVVKQLGQGGMGSVYLVRHNVLDSLFALKILASDVASKNKQFVDRFIREAKLACKIRHPNLIAVHDAGKNPQNGLYYIVMDYVSGGSVRDLLKKTPRIPPSRALEIITQVADALTAACAHRMVHRDIKPDNIMFAADGSVKLADLGIAKSTDEQDTMITMAASVFGTPAYMSPEQARDSSKVDSRADIYSLGIVFFEMLSGQRPFSGNTAIQILSQVMDSSSIPDIRQVCPDAPADLALLISRMTEKNLEKRIQNPDILLQELRKIRIPPQIGSSPLRTRGEIMAGSMMAASMNQATGATMPTVTTDASAPMPQTTMPTVSDAPASAPDVTMPTMATAPSVPAYVPEEPAPSAPMPASAPAFTPDVTMPTMAETPAPAAPSYVPEDPVPSAQTIEPEAPGQTGYEPVPPAPSAPESAPAFTPDVTMPTMAETPVPTAPAYVPEESAPAAAPSYVPEEPAPTAPAYVPEASAPTASAYVPEELAPTAPAYKPVPPAPSAPPTSARETTIPTLASEPTATAPAPAAAETNAASPAASSQKNRKLLILAVAAVALIVISGVSVAGVYWLFLKRPSEQPEPKTDPGQKVVTTTTTDTRNTQTSVTDSGVKTVTQDLPDIGGSTPEVKPSDPVPDNQVVVVPPVTEEMIPDPLGKNQVVLLADISDVSRKTKKVLVDAFGAQEVSFQEAEGMGSYKRQAAEIVKSNPSVVVVCFALQYAEDGVSSSGYESVIDYHAAQFQENGVPFLFVQPYDEEDNDRLRPYLDVTRDVCQQRSIPLVGAEDLTGERFLHSVREIKRPE